MSIRGEKIKGDKVKGDKVKREATSIKIRPEVWKEAKIEAIKRDVDLSELVETALEKEVRGKNQRQEVI
jgi:post-segregation antitoxin (ccd killing protein)